MFGRSASRVWGSFEVRDSGVQRLKAWDVRFERVSGLRWFRGLGLPRFRVEFKVLGAGVWLY